MLPTSRRIQLVVLQSARLDTLLLAELQLQLAPTLSRAKLKELFNAQAVKIQGRALPASAWLDAGTYEIEVELDLQALAPPKAARSKHGSFLPIVYEDADLLVLNKTSGVPSAPLSSDETETAVGSALAHTPELAQCGRGGLEPGLLHRLDTGTSGLLVFARTPEAFAFFRDAWKNREVRKIYRALAPPVAGSQAPHRLSLNLPLVHDAHSAKRMRVFDPKLRASQYRGKPLETVTHITTHRAITPALYDLQIEIETGVMHQIRCTLEHLGSPILGDPIYGGASAERLWLHAWRLQLPLRGGGQIWLESALPPGWATFKV